MFDDFAGQYISATSSWSNSGVLDDDYTLDTKTVIDEDIRKSNGTSYWYWLRSPEYNIYRVARVNNDGFSSTAGYYDANGAVRPACFVTLD